MDFKNHPLNNRQSIVDNRQTKVFSQSTIDYQTNRLKTKLGDPNLGEGLVALALMKLGEAEIEKIANYVLRKANHPGKAFVSLCNKAIKERP